MAALTDANDRLYVVDLRIWATDDLIDRLRADLDNLKRERIELCVEIEHHTRAAIARHQAEGAPE